jgi:hypothetical protein
MQSWNTGFHRTSFAAVVFAFLVAGMVATALSESVTSYIGSYAPFFSTVDDNLAVTVEMDLDLFCRAWLGSDGVSLSGCCGCARLGWGDCNRLSSARCCQPGREGAAYLDGVPALDSDRAAVSGLDQMVVINLDGVSGIDCLGLIRTLLWWKGPTCM